MAKLFFGGIPTDIDIRRLRETYTELPEGMTMSYEDVANIIGSPYGSNRFVTVTNRWRSQMFSEQNICIGTITGEAFVVLDPSSRLVLSCKKQETGFRSIRKGGRILKQTDRKRLNDTEAKTMDHTLRVMETIAHAAAVEKRRQVGPVACPMITRAAS